MQANLKTKNIVLLGSFSPSQFDKYFFLKNSIVQENEILQGSLFEGLGGVQLVTEKFHVIVSLNQIIISDIKPELNEDYIPQIAISIIKAANIKTSTALGINFHWLLVDQQKELGELSRELFFNEKIDFLNKFFASNDSMFGVYASTSFKESRLKLDVKPSVITEIKTGIVQSGINFGFNFHFDIKNKDDNSTVLSYISDYNNYKTETENIISSYK